FYLFDALGSVVNLATDAGAVKTRYQYDAWGNPRRTVGSSENIFGYTGHEKDTETGLYYFKARFYDPDTGRFITQDPYLGDINTPPSLHRYLYAHASPMVYVDPDGYESVTRMIDNAAEGCNAFTCAFYALGQAAYQVGTVGFASVHDPVRDAYDEGKITGSDYVVNGIGKGAAVAAVGLATGRAATPFIVGATTVKGVAAVTATAGFVEGAATDAITQNAHISTGIQEEYDVGRTLRQGAIGTVIGAAAGGGTKAYTNIKAAKTSNQALITTETVTSRGRIEVVAPETSRGRIEVVAPETSRGRIEVVGPKTNGMSDLARQRAELKGVDTSDMGTNPKGTLGESRTAITMQKAGYQELPARLSRNNGFDGVWVKYDTDGGIVDIVISESKFSSTGSASLTNTKTMGKQLSSEWIDANIQKMRLSDDAAVRNTARMLQRNRDIIRTKAAVINPAGVQRFNQINIPE
ncbi:MAG: RHS repeat-associated core domain-containing protein, partial [Gammaproteobacteria bacterium]